LVGRQSTFSVQTRFQITRLPSITESAVVVLAQKRSDSIAIALPCSALTSPLTFGIHAARMKPPLPLPTTHEHGSSPAKQPIDSQLAPARQDLGTVSLVSMSYSKLYSK
jgi:hypothetical protein